MYRRISNRLWPEFWPTMIKGRTLGTLLVRFYFLLFLSVLETQISASAYASIIIYYMRIKFLLHLCVSPDLAGNYWNKRVLSSTYTILYNNIQLQKFRRLRGPRRLIGISTRYTGEWDGDLNRIKSSKQMFIKIIVIKYRRMEILKQVKLNFFLRL